MPGAIKVPNTNFYRAPSFADDLDAFGVWAADAIEQAILLEGPETVAAVFLEPVQNAGGCFPPPPGYFQRVREICDRYGVLLVSDEVICAFGRLGYWFGAERYDYLPDMITMAKGLTSGYSPLGALDRERPARSSPSSPATSLPPRDHLRRPPGVLRGRPRQPRRSSRRRTSSSTCAPTRTPSGQSLESLSDLPIVGDVRGDGYFFGIELVKDKETRETFDDDESERLLRGFLSPRLYDAGLVCRADDRGDPVDPAGAAAHLRAGRSSTRSSQILRSVLQEAWNRL